MKGIVLPKLKFHLLTTHPYVDDSFNDIFYFLPSGVSRWEGIQPNANIMGACGSCLQTKKTLHYVVTFLYTACVLLVSE